MPFAGMAQQPVFDFADDFTADRLRPEWTWNYPYATPEIELADGRLYLGGRPKEGVKTGTALCLRAVSPDYTLETALSDRNAGWSGLTVYGDAANLLVWGLQGDKVLLKLYKDGRETLLGSSGQIGSHLPVYLRIEVRGNAPAAFGYSTDGHAWKQVENLPVGAEDLLQWDRVARPGLYYQGPEGQAAEFEYMRMTNR